ncbi:G-protein coupled receptor Mth2 isoform X9 [Tribolium castaneum]|uniref:G-protein coupled receptor Mth2 isoform X9 n=1 Tax=Tribolium castaneum TaxID=7070 RepID=UPI00046C2EB5|nr:PREDICTED: G-protein coupled receptor Mth2 isoform X6 [Tribolium castaneum]|eukprot:XP_008191011.1 PREDICTED: G-protein coupled receptor Mth2 isoform X6 [Tribolium castaneum]
MGASNLKFVIFVLFKVTLICASETDCETNKCIRKCCADDEFLNFDKSSLKCDLNFGKSLRDLANISLYQIIHGKTCDPELMKIPLDGVDMPFTLDGNKVLWENMEFNHTTSCIDVYGDKVVALVCTLGDEEEQLMAAIGMIISMPFLLLTFIAYALLPDRNLHMKALMFYVINLMFSYLLLVIIQLSESQFAEATCKSLGYFCLFFFLVSFFWMNVICIDIWWGFSGLRGFTGSKKTAERKRFLFYCAYAWGMPVLHVLVVFIIDILANQNSVLKPDIGNGQCFLRRGFPELLYFYGPMAILITINIVLFAITAIKIRRIKSETAMLKKEDSKRHSYENDRQIFNLYVKLLFAMGVNWSMEIISWAVIWAEEAPEAIWYLTDFCNAIYGVFIFFIFVFKRSIWKLLKKRYYTFIGKHHLAHSMTMTNTTRVTSYSTATSTIQETAHGGDNDTSTLKHDP